MGFLFDFTDQPRTVWRYPSSKDILAHKLALLTFVMTLIIIRHARKVSKIVVKNNILQNRNSKEDIIVPVS